MHNVQIRFHFHLIERFICFGLTETLFIFSLMKEKAFKFVLFARDEMLFLSQKQMCLMKKRVNLTMKHDRI